MLDSVTHLRYAAQMRISVIVTPEEHAKIKRAAGLVPLSAFLKRAVLDSINYDLGKRGKNGVVLRGMVKGMRP